MMLVKHLTPRALEGLKSYQYKSGGYTYLDDFHTPIWNCAVSCPSVHSRTSDHG
jgi:hypothetical protein